jgi:hypothetical protein
MASILRRPSLDFCSRTESEQTWLAAREPLRCEPSKPRSPPVSMPNGLLHVESNELERLDPMSLLTCLRSLLEDSSETERISVVKGKAEVEVFLRHASSLPTTLTHNRLD